MESNERKLSVIEKEIKWIPSQDISFRQLTLSWNISMFASVAFLDTRTNKDVVRLFASIPEKSYHNLKTIYRPKMTFYNVNSERIFSSTRCVLKVSFQSPPQKIKGEAMSILVTTLLQIKI